ncbi:MAG TPA: winged helix-turn-helix domain-containing protein [Nitrososphaera sp.]|jgi:predicted transcriptional regulator
MVRVLEDAHDNTHNRDRIDIISSVIDCTNGGAYRRKILLTTGLSSTQFKKYLSLLVQGGYIEIEEENGQKIYRATEKGIAFLQVYNNIRELLQ